MCVLLVVYKQERKKSTQMLSQSPVRYSLAGAIDQYLGRIQAAGIVRIKKSSLKTTTEMQYSSQAGLSQAGYHLESPGKKTDHWVLGVTALRATN